MQLAFSRTIDLDCSAATAWTLVREPVQFAGCIGVLEGLAAVDGGPGYEGMIVDRVGPFRIALALDALVEIDDTTQTIVVKASGNDRRTNTRASGTLRARSRDRDGGSSIELVANMEILGVLASLGSGPIRRRMEQVTEATSSCLRQMLGG